jgi:hypothetical protein
VTDRGVDALPTSGPAISGRSEIRSRPLRERQGVKTTAIGRLPAARSTFEPSFTLHALSAPSRRPMSAAESEAAGLDVSSIT